MLSPFPGMNPYLEDPEMWPEVHHWIITLIAELLVPQLRPKYRVAIEKRVYQSTDEESLLVGIPDVSVGRNLIADKGQSNVAVATPPSKPVTVRIPMVEEVREGYLEVREVGTGEVITVIELLSPKNKRAGKGRQAYEKKRLRVLDSLSHLVEIDLLRGGKPMPILGDRIQASYRILVSRSNKRPTAELYPFELQEPIPTFPLPLRQGDTEPIVDLQALLQGVYDRAGLDMAIDYTREPVPPLAESDAAWANALLQQQGFRS
ncbi:DUF4058 family protein [Iningainema tapete]|uniref:DUF4058 family protein n=1 Tax=Iningainema tapete BLCC-T55 TaxID=2748662 RepID=A0A8J6XTE6_9CYAN|nr:DUF4058 family protein [Iningainema tapete]MBD2777925.1 DUF4058 family protein [Iningainema tapete BLCC-T55]